MKERLANVLAWWAFVHALIIALAIATAGGKKTELEHAMDYYFDVFLDSPTLLLAFAPVTWMALYVLTGNPRILPWKRPEQVEEE